jgi:hypothetical protein
MSVKNMWDVRFIRGVQLRVAPFVGLLTDIVKLRFTKLT